MEKKFASWLVDQGYRQYTPGGKPSTVYDYVKRIDFVCAEEKCTWMELATIIEQIIPQYDAGGIKQALGNRSHRAVINALKRFSEFVAGTRRR